MKKCHSKLPKNELVSMCKKGWFFGLGQEGVCLHEGTLKGGGIEKRVGERKFLKKGGKLGRGVGAFK